MTKDSNHDINQKMPVLFIGHGSPMNMVENNLFTKTLAILGKTLPRPVAIMVISAHWLTSGTFVTCDEHPRLIYDFYGFPPELYEVKYECNGAASIARQIVSEVGKEKINCSNSWGLDHAAYSILRHIYPDADIPVFEMSLDYEFGEKKVKPISYHYELGKNLRYLRNMGILIIGSGNIVHNLRFIDSSESTDASKEWAAEADKNIKSLLMKTDHDALINFPYSGGSASIVVPTLDHYLPLIYTLSLQEENEHISFIYEGFQNGTISMRSLIIG